MEDKVYEPEVIVENPFPNQESPVIPQTTKPPEGTYNPTTTKEKSFPTRKIATELLSTALNTRSKKILQEFELTQSGGFKIGNFEEGVSGEITITPNGIVTKDKAGIVTIAIYGDDGSGVFKGSIQAGSIITGLISVGDNSIVIDGEAKRQVWYDSDGIPQIVIGNA
jgi:hypothetical protein